MTNLNPGFSRRRERKEESSFFACLQCYPDEGEIDSKSLSSTHSRQDFQKIAMQPQPPSIRTSQQVYLTTQDLMDSRRSQFPRTDKISIKGRRSTMQRQSVEATDPDLPFFLPRQTYRQEANQQIPFTHRSRDSELNMSIRSSEPRVSFSYRQQTTPLIKSPEQQQRQRPTPLDCKNVDFNKSPQYLKSPNDEMNLQIRSKTSLSSPLKLLNPKVVVSKNIDENTNPIDQSEFMNHFPHQQSHAMKIQYTDKKLTDLYKEKEGEMYDSFEPIPKLSAKKSSKKYKNFGGNSKFKVRQTVSIKEPEEEDDYVHESIVLERTNNQSGMLQGLLHPINESDEYTCGMSTNLFSQMKQI